MSTYQNGIFEQAGPHHHYLEFKIRGGAEDTAIKSALVACQSFPLAERQTRVIAFGHGIWSRLAPATTPPGLRDFETINGAEGHQAPSTQGDLWVWIQGAAPDINLDVALQITGALRGSFDLRHEIQGFAYHGNRDLIGFVDGTANPKTADDQHAAALVPGTNGGSFLLTQKWVHDLAAFNRLGTPQQEAVVGRTKHDDIELEGDDMPDDSHVSRTDASEDGVSLKLWRRSAPYGGALENGLYFVAFACDIRRFEVQLHRMYGTSGDGLHDHLIHFSKAVSGSYWYVPGTEELAAALS